MKNCCDAAGVCLLVFLVCWCAGISRCWAQQPETRVDEVLVFTNGDQLKGRLVRGVGSTIVFKSDMAGEITVALDKVRELRSVGGFALLRKDVPVAKQPVVPAKIRVEAGMVTPEGQAAVPAGQVGYLIDAATYQKDVEVRPTPWEGWNGSVAAGLTLQRSTQNGSTYTAGVALVRSVPPVAFLPPRNRTSVDFTETYGKITQPVIPATQPPSADAVAKTSILHAALERDEYASQRFYGLVQTAFDHNFSQGLDLQQLFGAGVGWTPIQRAAEHLDLKLDVHYEKEQFATASGNQNLVGSLFSEAYRRNLQRRMVLTQTLNVLPAWNNLDASSANASVVLTAPLLRRLNMTVTATDSYLNNPAAGFRKNSFQLQTGVSYSLR